jgi:hypothetical protein
MCNVATASQITFEPVPRVSGGGFFVSIDNQRMLRHTQGLGEMHMMNSNENRFVPPPLTATMLGLLPDLKLELEF